MTGRIAIDDVVPAVSGGEYPAKAVVGELFPVRATVWREGHDAVSATLVIRLADNYTDVLSPDLGSGRHARAATPPPAAKTTKRKPIVIPMDPGVEPDTVVATFTPDTEGLWTFRVDAWSDPIATWRHNVSAKLAVGQTAAELANDLEIGAQLFTRAASGVPAHRRDEIAAVATALRSDAPAAQRVAPALSDDVTRILRDFPLRELLTRGKTYGVWADRQRALFSSWYEFFPRSTGGWDADGNPVHGTFDTATSELERAARMGFNVVYLPPIHPVGEVNRKGPNNTLTPGPQDVGSPWAIGSADGGHDAIHPRLGTFEDFDRFVSRARELDLEIALDLALQCAPDHPWAKEHPEWFTVLPDGTIAYAENPPKKYQDIYPLNFDNDPEGLAHEVLRVVRLWISHGVRIFRVDNPHTKPANFWQWLIAQVKTTDPDVLFLSEAFTRPARLYGLAKVGFTQSYTYFTWRTSKAEITEFGTELSFYADIARPNLFVNTPDILHASLQYGGPGMFAIRAVLAATLGPSWGVYSGFELFEHKAVREGSEEYLDSEKYELRPRDFDGALRRGESLEPFLTNLNRIRSLHPALAQLRLIHFHHVDNDAVLAYSKVDANTGDAVLVVVNINPFGAEEATINLDLPALGLEWQDRFWVRDEISGEEFHWGASNYVKLDPTKAVAHIVTLPNIGPEHRLRLLTNAPRR